MSMSWWEIRILCHPNLEESILWRLDQFDCSSTAREIRDKFYLIYAYIPEIKGCTQNLASLSLWLQKDASMTAFPLPSISWKLIEEEDWAISWKKHWQPTEVGNHFLIYPAWLTPPEKSDRLVLRLDPGTVFGTGTHATTRLCLESLEMYLSYLTKETVIADIGSGSGILSIGAILLGAAKLCAVDIDPLAINAALNNRSLNQIHPSVLVISQGSIQEISNLVPEGVDGILCNILAEVIIKFIPQLTALAKPNAWGILSGILFDQFQLVANTLKQYGWAVIALSKQQEWCCIQIRRS